MEQIRAQKRVIQELKLELFQEIALLSRIPVVLIMVFRDTILLFPSGLVFALFKGVEKNK